MILIMLMHRRLLAWSLFCLGLPKD
jgi:hypothetical protein